MKRDSYQTTSGTAHTLWLDIAQKTIKDLPGDLSTDVCIIGAGIAGLSVAYSLLAAGKKVIILESRNIGSGETGRTSAHISNILDDHYIDLEKAHGSEGARLIAQSHGAAIDFIESVKGSFHFKRIPGYLFDGTDKQLEEEFEAATRAGMQVEMTYLEGKPALKFFNQARIHPIKYLNTLAQHVIENGGHIYRAHAVKVEEGLVTTDEGSKIFTEDIVVTTNTPINNRFTIHTKQAPYRTYIIAGPTKKRIEDALYWDWGDEIAYHYVRFEGDMLIVGGEDHKTGQADDAEKRYAKLERWAKEKFHLEKVEYRWSGQVFNSIDHIGFIGRNPGDKHIYIASGDTGSGMTNGTIAGILIPDLILGRKNPWEKLYDPTRKHLNTTFFRENINVAKQYSDYIFMDTDHSIPKGTGIVIREDDHIFACAKDKDGNLHKVSAVCTHLGCLVHWNTGEQSWDCPCHGSRFSPDGQVLCGPARKPLRKFDVEEESEPISQKERAST